MFAFICVLFIELSFKCSFTASFFISVLAFIWHLFFKCIQFNKYFFFLVIINLTGWSSNLIPGHSDFPLGIICDRGSFEVHFGDHLRPGDHLRSGIICGTVQYFWFQVMGIIERVFGFEISIPGFFLVGNIFRVFFGVQLDLSRDKSHYGSW